MPLEECQLILNLKDVAWLIWEVIRDEASKEENIEKIVESLLSLYCLKYKPGCKEKEDL